MSLIRKAEELSIPKTVKMMIYGQAGMGKTTLALSAPKPLLLDFDGGVKRVNLGHLKGVDIVQITSWQDVKELMNEDLSGYQSIVIDTVGKMVDYIILSICGTRNPQIKDWGKVNQEFTWFTRAVSSLNKHIIFVAHRDYRKEGDDTVFIPALREKNYNAIVTELDLLGYLEMKKDAGVEKRTITFDPTSRNDGKNTCNLPGVMYIPSTVDKNGNAMGTNDFIQSKILAPYIGMITAKEEAQQKYNSLIKEISESIELITDADGANHFIQHINDYEHVGSSLQKARALFSAKINALGLVYNKDTKTYSNVA